MMQDPTYESLQKKLENLEDEARLLALAEEKLFESLDLTKEEVKELLNNPAGFPMDMWKSYLKMKEAMKAEIQAQIKAIPHPKKTEEARKKLNLPSFALFCR